MATKSSQQKTARCDELRADIVGLTEELTAERQQRIESNALLLATAWLAGLDDSEVDELPHFANRAREWSEKSQTLEVEVKALQTQVEGLRRKVEQRELQIRKTYRLTEAKRAEREAQIRAEDSAICQEWDEKCRGLQWDYNEAMRQYDEAQKRACETETKLTQALAHIKSLDARITLEVSRQDELREAYHKTERQAEQTTKNALEANRRWKERVKTLEAAIKAEQQREQTR